MSWRVRFGTRRRDRADDHPGPRMSEHSCHNRQSLGRRPLGVVHALQITEPKHRGACPPSAWLCCRKRRSNTLVPRRRCSPERQHSKRLIAASVGAQCIASPAAAAATTDAECDKVTSRRFAGPRRRVSTVVSAGPSRLHHFHNHANHPSVRGSTFGAFGESGSTHFDMRRQCLFFSVRFL